MLSANTYRQFLVTVKILSLISFVAIIAIELAKYWREIDTEWSFLLGVMVLLAYSIGLIAKTDFDLKETVYAWMVSLFLFALLVEEIDRKIMLVLILAVPWFNHDGSRIYPFAILVLLLFYYIFQSVCAKKDIKCVVSASAFAVFLINRAFINFYLREW